MDTFRTNICERKAIGPTSTNTIRAIHQDGRKHRHIPFRFNRVAIVDQVIENWVIMKMEDRASDLREMGENITSRGRVFTTLMI
jgi:hypothetical protein